MINVVKLWIKKNPRLLTILGVGVLCLIALVTCQHHKGSSDAAQMYQADVPWPVGWRMVYLFLSTLIGFGIGAFFSPLLRKFRKIIFIIVAVIVLLFAVFGPYPIADGVNGFSSVILFLIAFFWGLSLCAKEVKEAVAKKRPTSFG